MLRSTDSENIQFSSHCFADIAKIGHVQNVKERTLIDWSYKNFLFFKTKDLKWGITFMKQCQEIKQNWTWQGNFHVRETGH